MSDLIIKPIAGSGNKVIIQDQAGGALLTSATSGATIENATMIKLIATTTANAPTGVEGAIFYDSTKNALMQYNGTTWDTISDGPTSGGTVTTYGSYKSHTFLATGYFVAGTDLTCDVLVVAGGGGGGGGDQGSGAHAVG